MTITNDEFDAIRDQGLDGEVDEIEIANQIAVHCYRGCEKAILDLIDHTENPAIAAVVDGLRQALKNAVEGTVYDRGF